MIFYLSFSPSLFFQQTQTTIFFKYRKLLNRKCRHRCFGYTLIFLFFQLLLLYIFFKAKYHQKDKTMRIENLLQILDNVILESNKSLSLSSELFHYSLFFYAYMFAQKVDLSFEKITKQNIEIEQ